MSFSLVYLAQRFFYRIYECVRHWYAGGLFWFAGHTVALLESLDRFFALRITLRYWLKPLYQDYTLVGYLFGFIFRTARLIAGGVVYAAICAAAAFLYVAWAAIPIFIIYKGFFAHE